MLEIAFLPFCCCFWLCVFRKDHYEESGQIYGLFRHQTTGPWWSPRRAQDSFCARFKRANLGMNENRLHWLTRLMLISRTIFAGTQTDSGEKSDQRAETDIAPDSKWWFLLSPLPNQKSKWFSWHSQSSVITTKWSERWCRASRAICFSFLQSAWWFLCFLSLFRFCKSSKPQERLPSWESIHAPTPMILFILSFLKQ